MIRAIAVTLLLVACRADDPPRDPRATACIESVDRLGADLAGVDHKLRDALVRDRAEAARLLRASVELVLVTRELQCAQVEPTQVRAALANLAATREAFDALLASTISEQPPPNEAELIDRFSRALLAPGK